MKAIVVNEYGSPDSLKYQELNLLEPSANQVLISVKYAGVNFPDTLIIRGKYQFQPEMPFAPGGEVAGIIKKVGENVTRFEVGDRVVSGTSWGGFAEEALGFESNTHLLPDGVSFEEGAATLMTFATTYHALKDRAKLKSGEKLAVLGASGGVGSAAIQLGKLIGTEIIACASTDEKLALCKQLGAKHLYKYDNPQSLKTTLKSLTNSKGVDVIFDPIGGEWAEQAFRAIAPFGRYLVVGFAAGSIPAIPWNLPLLKSADIMGVFWGGFFRNFPKENQANVKQLLEWLKKGEIKPSIDEIFPLKEAPKAILRLENREVKGKLLIEI